MAMTVEEFEQFAKSLDVNDLCFDELECVDFDGMCAMYYHYNKELDEDSYYFFHQEVEDVVYELCQPARPGVRKKIVEERRIVVFGPNGVKVFYEPII